MMRGDGNETETKLWLPTKKEIDEFFTDQTTSSDLIAYIRAKIRDHSAVMEVFNDCCARMLAKVNKKVPFMEGPLRPYICRVAKNCVHDRFRRKEAILFSQLEANSPTGSNLPVEPIDGEALPPSQIARERERGQRRTKLLSEVIADYCRRCEAKPQRLDGKEILERTVWNQPLADIALATEKTEGAAKVAQSRALYEIRMAFDVADERHSVLVTFWRREKSRKNRQLTNDPLAIEHIDGLREYLLTESGAFCPAVERLKTFASCPHDAGPRDIRFHVKEVGCVLCNLLLERL